MESRHAEAPGTPFTLCRRFSALGFGASFAGLCAVAIVCAREHVRVCVCVSIYVCTCAKCTSVSVSTHACAHALIRTLWSRGPRSTDPDPRDFMYSFYYDYISSKEEYNRRKLCMNGYSKEAREIAAERRGQFLERDHMPKRTKRSTGVFARPSACAGVCTLARACVVGPLI